MKSKTTASALFKAAAAVVASFSIVHHAFAVTATNTSGPVLQGTSDGSTNSLNNNPAVTISFSGQTALRTFDTSEAITELQPGTSIILHDGTNGAPVVYTATNDDFTNVQLASPTFNTPDVWEDSSGNSCPPGTLVNGTVADIQVNSAINLEWHEQGSVDGFYDLVNDEVGYAQNAAQAVANNSIVGPISNEALRTPSSSNPTWVNTNKFTSASTIDGFSLDNSASDDLAQTYNTNVYTPATGANIQGGQNRIQFSVGEYPTEAVSVGGVASPFATAGSAGYGQGNPALKSSAVALTALGSAGLRQQFQPSAILNESTAIDDPQTGTNYTSGPWNSAGVNNVTSTAIAATAVTYSANPGTGLQRIDLGDAQWLQTTGRLQNGALFNVVARTVDTGQRIVFGLNTGIDPSWAVGSNDDGNSTSTAAANPQHTIGSSLRFDGKTSGSEAEKTIAQSRMAVGALSVPEARAAASNAPVRALDVDFTDQTDVNPSDDATNFIRANFNTIVSSNAATRYPAVLISHYNSIKSPNATALGNELNALGINPATATATQQAAAWALVQSFNPSNLSDPTASGIKGDTTGDVAAFIANIANSVATAATAVTPASANDPADGLLSTGFLLPNLLDWTRVTDGGPITPVTLSAAAQSEQSQAQANYGPLFTTDNSAAANSQTIGSGSTYADGNSTGPAVNGAIPITAKDASGNPVGNGTIAPGGNYLFGNFNQNGVRDFSAVEQAANAALSLYAVDSASGGDNSIYTGAVNSTVIPSLVGTPGWAATHTNTKGDLITLGDYNGDGKFDGQDLYLLAIGASLADNTSSGTLTATAATFSDAVRNPTVVLRKNAALDYINNYLSTTSDTSGAAFLRNSGAAVLTGTVPFGATDLHSADPITGLEQFTYDPTGVNAFNKNDVNRDGVVDFNDGVLVDAYNGQSYQNLSQSLAATAPTPVTGVTEPISLVVVQQVDGEPTIGAGDLAVLNAGLTGVANANWYAYNLQKSGPGTINWQRTGGIVTVYPTASFEISSGVVDVGGTVDPFSDNNATGPTVGDHVSLKVDGGGTLALTQSGRVVTVSALSVDTASGSSVDVGINGLAIDFGGGTDPVATIAGYLASGYNGGHWTGPGISSSSAAAANPIKFSVGYLDSADPGGTAGSVIVKYTLAGDANLDGSVGIQDLLIIAQNFGQTGKDWSHGDFTYDPAGAVGIADLLLVAQNFGHSTPISIETSGASLSTHWELAAVVPEPTSAGLVAMGGSALIMLDRRRKKGR